LIIFDKKFSGKIMSIESIGDRIRTIRGKESRKSFAERFGIGTATLQRYEDSERNPDLEFFLKLQKESGRSMDYLIHGHEFALAEDENFLLKNYRESSSEIKHATILASSGVGAATNHVVNKQVHSGQGDQFNAKKQKVDKSSRVNNFNGNFGGDYVDGDKHNH
jgi:transcriptional regulator with XRE-family HTH domain